MTRAATVLALATLALALSACDSKVGGTPQAAGTSSSSAPTTKPSGATGDNPFGDMKPCTTLDQALNGQGYPASVPTTADAARSCTTEKKTGDDSIRVSLSLHAGQTINENIADPSKASTGTVNDRPAVQEREPIGAKGQCSVGMEVKPKSRALVAVTLGVGTTDQACTDVNDISTKVEPLLPK
ncbi:DUF3558 family protein [Amycolatopsis sp. CA-126428]|uniref:DUF3558 family protein n=1 Tax=Amycolatopsis sp. CA-126428 TaxID=2073158 RepID=UPI000CCFE3DD|nr:DUF3558 family protein [Amycolatopsis sp. CA-126428]